MSATVDAPIRELSIRLRDFVVVKTSRIERCDGYSVFERARSAMPSPPGENIVVADKLALGRAVGR